MNRSAFLALAEQVTDGDDARAIPALRRICDVAGRALAARVATLPNDAPPSGTWNSPMSEAERHWLDRVLS